MNEQVNYAKIQRIQDNLEALTIGTFGTGFVTDSMLYESGIKATVASHTSDLADIATNALQIGFKNDGSTNNVSSLANITSDKIILFPSGTYYFNNTAVTTLTVNNVTLLGSANTVFKVNSDKQFLKFLNCNNITVKNIKFIDATYTDNIYFQEVTLPSPQANTNANITVTINSMALNIVSNGNTPYGTTEKYAYTITLDQTKEYTLETYEGLVSGNAYDYIKITRYFTDATTQTNILNLQVSTVGHQGQWRWLSNYIPTGVTKVDLEFYYTKPYSITPPIMNIDLTKIKLFSAIKTLPASIDDFMININTCNNVVFENNEFTGILNSNITNLGTVTNLIYIRNKFTNCFNSNIDMGNCKNGYAYNNKIYRNLTTATGQDVYYTKCSTRGVGGANSDNIRIIDNYIEGTYFGTELHTFKNLLISGNKIKNTHWGHSLVTNTTGKVENETFEFRYAWRHAIELAQDVKVDVSNINMSGDSYQSFCFSLTDNKAGTINISNINVDKTFCLIQFNKDGFNLNNIKINELHGIGILVLANGSYDITSTRIRMSNLDFTLSSNFTTISYGYIAGFIALTPFSGYFDKVTIKDSVFNGSSPKGNLFINAKYLLIDSLLMKDTVPYGNAINVDTSIADRLTIIQNSNLYKTDINNDYTTSSKIIVRNNVLSNTNLPTTAIKQNNIINGVFTA